MGMDVAERRRRAVELYEEGLPVAQVAQKIGCGTSTAWRDLKGAGVRFRHSNEPQTTERVCERDGCENVFRPTPQQVRNGYGKYCSRACDHEAHRKHPVPEPRPCARCGTIFTPDAYNAAAGWGKYCSKRCSAVSTDAHVKRSGRLVTCPQCKKEHWRYDNALAEGRRRFVAGETKPRNPSRFCSLSCWAKYRHHYGEGVSLELWSYQWRIRTADDNHEVKRIKGGWASHRASRDGELARPRKKSYTPEKAAEVLAMKAEAIASGNPRQGSVRVLARRAKLTEWQIRSILKPEG